MRSTPSATSASSDAADAATSNQAGETMNRRASPASRSGGPYKDSHGSALAYHPARRGTSQSTSPRTVANPMPRGEHSHLYAAHEVTSKWSAPTGSHPMAWVAST